MTTQKSIDEETKNIIAGRKTFFIVPDVSLLPESYLEDYLARGYETYIIGDDRYCPLQKKIDIITSVFPDCILFFYIDTIVQNFDWNVYINKLQIKYKDSVLIGVLYAKRQSEADKQKLEKYYLYDVGIKCGCIALEYQKAKNFALIDKVMYANQACGRRRNVRVICDDSSKINFDYCGKVYKSHLSDISISHFSCIMDLNHDQAAIPLYEKINNVFVEVNGMHFHSDTVLIMQRQIGYNMLYIFVFTKTDGSQGLDNDTIARLLQKIYQMVTDKAKNLMRSMFDEAGKKLRNSGQ